MKQAILWGITAILAGFGIYYAAFCQFNFGNLCVWLLAAASLCYTLCWRRIDVFFQTGAGRALLWVLMAGAVCFAAVLGVILTGQVDRTTGTEETLVVLGCAVRGDQPTPVLTCRLEKALDWYAQHPDGTLVVCGGQGKTETMPEGRVMCRWLVDRGVPEAQILVDDTSTSTEENFANARALLEARGISAAAPTAFVTNGFHCYRAAQYARQAGFSDARALPAGLPLSQYLTCYIREVFALVYYWVFKSPDQGFLRGLVGLLWLDGRS